VWPCVHQVMRFNVASVDSSQVTECPKEADFILAHGTEAISSADASSSVLSRSVADLEQLLEQAAAAHRPPLVVANPGELLAYPRICACSLQHESYDAAAHDSQLVMSA
jgi:hypothetical protein